MAIRPTVYVETSVVSYLTSAPSRDLVIAAHQFVTRQWWSRRDRFDVYVSAVVRQEAKAGDPVEAAKRVSAIDAIPILAVSPAVEAFAQRLLTLRALPANARHDALHVAISAVHGVEILLTWDRAYLANVQARAKIHQVCLSHDHTSPRICTPEDLGAE